jgi:hypothetical protein
MTSIPTGRDSSSARTTEPDLDVDVEDLANPEQLLKPVINVVIHARSRRTIVRFPST